MIKERLKILLTSYLLLAFVLLNFYPLSLALAQEDSSLPVSEDISQNSDNLPDNSGIFFDENESKEAIEDNTEESKEIDPNIDTSEENQPITDDDIEIPEQKPKSVFRNYNEFISSFNAWRTGVGVGGEILSESARDAEKQKIIDNWALFIVEQKEYLDSLNVTSKKQDNYFQTLDKYYRILTNQKTLGEKVKSFFGSLLPLSKEDDQENNLKILENPGTFDFKNSEATVDSLDELYIDPAKQQGRQSFFSLPQGVQTTNYPSLADLESDQGEVLIDSSIIDLAQSLGNNPVNIFNFVRDNITYQPYYGAKKGSLGCLAEKVCNDVDSASLFIALARASGIPARYKKDFAVVSVLDLKNLLGVGSNKNAFAVLALADVPVFTVEGQVIDGSLDEIDLSTISHLVLEWVHTEIFYEYDERGANISNVLDFSDAESDQELIDIFSAYPKKTWIPVETVIRPYSFESSRILADEAEFNAQDFWLSYLQYQGSLNPLEKYESDIASATGQNINNSTLKHFIVEDMFDILPPKLPYLTAQATQVPSVSFTVLPDEYRYKLRLSLQKEDGGQTVLSHTFYASEINNLDLSLNYNGATESDSDIITAFGGVHLTPASLVDIKAVLSGDNINFAESLSLKIGEQLILEFNLVRGSKTLHNSEKFSLAGNEEGIVIAFGKVREKLNQDTAPRILLAGNTGIARAYLLGLQEKEKLLANSLAYSSKTDFSRAVVTQNRILNRVDSLPTSFNFKGLTMDAASLISDSSRQGDYKSHREDFRLLFGLAASYDEAQIFKDIAGLEGISTVAGLQYAYANNNDYNVQVITSENKDVISGLELSENTKNNLLVDVEAGNTIVTPSKPVGKGNWNGIFYISLSPDFTGNYAIGEQVAQNGGWTTNQFLSVFYNGASGEQKRGSLYSFGNERFYHEDTAVDSVYCRINDAEYFFITNAQDWNNSYGFPCNIDSVSFGDINHSYILTSNATKFFSTGKYDYWTYRGDIVGKVNNYINNLSSVDDVYQFRFSTTLGTYLISICSDKFLFTCKTNKYETVYYVPYQSGSSLGRAYRVKEGFLNKVSENDNALIKILGFPLSDEITATTSPYGTNGIYQDFVNGQLFYYTKWTIQKIYYTYGKLTAFHKNSGGTAGELGFPEDDPKQLNNNIYQRFEDDNEIGLDLNTGIVKSERYQRYRCEISGNINDSLRLGLITSRGILDTITSTVSGIFGLLGSVVSAISNPFETSKDAYELAQEVSNLDGRAIKDFLNSVGDSTKKALISEYDTALGANGCPARASYLLGRVTGEVLLIAVPASKLKTVEKVKAINIAAKSEGGVKVLSFVGKWLEYRKGVLDNISDLAVSGKFERDAIEETLLGKFNETTNKFQGLGLHSPRTLKQGMESGVLEVRDISETIVYKKYSDIPVDSNGIREVKIRKTDGFSNPKTIFPDNWSDKDTVESILEASQTKLQGNEFGALITKKGVSVDIRGYFEVKEGGVTNFIKTGFAKKD